jgi:alpha-beta hydrolase superfamily lysophospholipase
MLTKMAWVAEHRDALGVPTLVQHGADDTVAPTSCSEALEALRGVRRIVYPGLRHEIFNEPSHETVIDDLVAWLRGTVRPVG